jgi:catechol 2,3-dioxygenase
MSTAKVTGLRSIELGVRDLNQSAAFYSQIWGLAQVASEGDAVHLRATDAEHHVVTLRERPQAGLLGVHFAASDRAALNSLHAQAKAFGANVTSNPAELPGSAGGGYGFQFRTPEGHVLNVSADVARHPDTINDRSKPFKLSHIVLNSAKVGEQTAFFTDLLGFKLSDRTHMMDFIRCCADHHSIALAKADGPSLNHMAYEMTNFDGLMRGAGRLKQNGFNLEWGVGRHGPGDNVFSYFIEPNGFVAEYTTDMQQIDEAEYIPGTADYWANFPLRPCRWGMAPNPSNRLKAAMSGKLPAADEDDGNMRCEEVMAKTLAR